MIYVPCSLCTQKYLNVMGIPYWLLLHLFIPFNRTGYYDEVVLSPKTRSKTDSPSWEV